MEEAHFIYSKPTIIGTFEPIRIYDILATNGPKSQLWRMWALTYVWEVLYGKWKIPSPPLLSPSTPSYGGIYSDVVFCVWPWPPSFGATLSEDNFMGSETETSWCQEGRWRNYCRLHNSNTGHISHDLLKGKGLTYLMCLSFCNNWIQNIRENRKYIILWAFG